MSKKLFLSVTVAIVSLIYAAHDSQTASNPTPQTTTKNAPQTTNKQTPQVAKKNEAQSANKQNAQTTKKNVPQAAKKRLSQDDNSNLFVDNDAAYSIDIVYTSCGGLQTTHARLDTQQTISLCVDPGSKAFLSEDRGKPLPSVSPIIVPPPLAIAPLGVDNRGGVDILCKGDLYTPACRITYPYTGKSSR